MNQLLSQVQSNEIPFLLRQSQNLVCTFIFLLIVYGYILHYQVSKQYKNIIKEVVKCNKFQLYSHQMFSAMTSYQFLYMDSMNYLDPRIFDAKWLQRERRQNRHHFENITNLLTLDSFSNEALTTSNQFWLYHPYHYSFSNPDKTNLEKLQMNFHSFSRFFLNALQETNNYTRL